MRFLAGNFWVFSGCVIGYGQLILSTGFHRRVLQGFYEGLMNLYAFIWWRFSCFYRGLTFCFFFQGLVYFEILGSLGLEPSAI